MARHERPEHEKRPLNTYICNPKHRSYADKCIKFLSCFPILKVWEVQYPKPKNYTGWYVSFTHREKPWILNFSIYPSFTNVEFRYPQYLPNNILDRLKWQNNSWKYARFTDDTEVKLKKIVEVYLDGIRADFDRKKLKQGGKSFAEGFVSNLILDAFPGYKVIRNVRPEWLKGNKGKYLEIDIFVPDIKLAIEIQGPQHFVDLYSNMNQHCALIKNDLLKKETCERNGVRLIWMDWNGVNKGLIKLPYNERIRILKSLINDFSRSNHKFLSWKNIEEQVFE